MSSNYFWMIKALAGFLGVLGLQYAFKKIISVAGRKRGENWRLRIAKILKPPVTTLIWALFIVYLIGVFEKHSGFEFGREYLSAIRKTAVVVCSAWLFFRWKSEIENTLLSDPTKKVDVTT